MENRIFTYISSPKVDMLYDQNHSMTSKEFCKEMGAEFTGSITALSGRITTKKTTSVNIYEKLSYIENGLRNKKLVGNLFDNKPFIEDQCPIYSFYHPGQNSVSWNFSYHDTDNRILYNYLFYGSKYHIMGQNHDGVPETYTRSFIEFFMQDLILQIRDGIDGKEMLLGNLGDYSFYWGLGEDVKYWEALECLRELYSCNNDYAYMNRFLVRIDYRETITREKYLQSPIIQERSKSITRPDSFIRQSLMPRHYFYSDDVDYIVYIFGSPIYIEQKLTKEKIHIIDGKRLLYLSEEDLKPLVNCKAEKQQHEAAEKIKNSLWREGLLKESRCFYDRYWKLLYDNNWRILDEKAFTELIREYTTPIPLL